MGTCSVPHRCQKLWGLHRCWLVALPQACDTGGVRPYRRVMPFADSWTSGWEAVCGLEGVRDPPGVMLGRFGCYGLQYGHSRGSARNSAATTGRTARCLYAAHPSISARGGATSRQRSHVWTDTGQCGSSCLSLVPMDSRESATSHILPTFIVAFLREARAGAVHGVVGPGGFYPYGFDRCSRSSEPRKLEATKSLQMSQVLGNQVKVVDHVGNSGF